MHRVTNDESAGFARMPTWDDYSGPRKITAGTYVGSMVEPSTWAVITASAVRRTVTHVNAHRGSKAAMLAPEKLLFRLALSEKCLPRDEMKEKEEIPRELAEFIPAISARRARRFDARTDFFAKRKRWERNGEESCSGVRKQDVDFFAKTFFQFGVKE